MTIQHKENNFSVEANKEAPNTEKTSIARPNIDQLIKTIRAERKKEEQKNFFIFISILIVISGLITISLYN